MILKATDIRKTYRTRAEKIQVLNGVNLEISPGEIVVVMGPSGAGKSTLLHILGLIDNCDSGSIEFEGHVVNMTQDLSSIRARKLGFVFQYHHLLPEFTVLENLLIPQTLIGTKPADAKSRGLDLLNFMGLENRAEHYPSQISGGEKQRVALLRALVNSPRLVLADEPTGNLDLGNSVLLLKLITNLRDEFNQSFLIATHDRTVADVADRVLSLDCGKLS
ncbi:MAG: ABC transporter ATP-binding protein [FCB group bacterium]|nr:ABC transporter ATP-binding protein [FCB group bacterium]